MNIFGVGVDLIEIERVKKSCQRKHFLEKVFTPKEQEEICERETRCASDFAGKEAVVKMFGTGFGKITAGEIEILRNEAGAPYVTLYGEALAFAKEHKIQKIHISITNTKKYANAYVIGEIL